MATLLCTAKYRKAFGLPEALTPLPTEEGALGPWYAHTLNVGAQRYLHYMSESALLSVVIHLREKRSAEARFRHALDELLRSFDVSPEDLENELAVVETLQFARAGDRSKLASLRDQSGMAWTALSEGDMSVAEVNQWLAETPCGPMNYESPSLVAPRRLEEKWRWRRRSSTAK
jgi:hypothetical protein